MIFFILKFYKLKAFWEKIKEYSTPSGSIRIVLMEDGVYRFQIYGMNDYEMDSGHYETGWHTLIFNLDDNFKFKRYYAKFNTLQEAKLFEGYFNQNQMINKIRTKKAHTIKEIY